MRGALRRSLGIAFVATVFLHGTGAEAAITKPTVVSAVEQSGAPGLVATWKDPTFLLDDFSFTPVVEAGLATFRNGDGDDVGAMLILATEVSPANPTGLYPHDYRTCQSIHAGTLERLQPVEINGAHFVLIEMSRPSVHEFAVTLKIRDTGASFSLDSQTFSVLYPGGLSGRHYTFQVWSRDSATTVALVGRLVSALAAAQPLVVENSLPRTLPVAVARRIQMMGELVLLELEAPDSVSALDLTVVSWEYPNQSPNVQQLSKSILAGRSQHLLPVSAATTDVQVYLDHQGALQDKVLTSFNAWGPLSSGWFPFCDAGGSSAGIGRAPLSRFLPEDDEVVVNPAAVQLQANLANAGFVGMYLDVLPDLSGPADLRRYDRWILRAKQGGGPGLRPVEMKVELDDGTTRSTVLSVTSAWAALEIPVEAFGDWQSIGAHIERVVLAVTGASGSVALDVDRLSLHRAPETALAVPWDRQDANARTRLLERSRPNPFQPFASVRYRIQRAGPTRLAVLDAGGRLVQVLEEVQFKAPGRYETRWDGRDRSGRPVAPGVYFYVLTSAGQRDWTKAVRVQ